MNNITSIYHLTYKMDLFTTLQMIPNDKLLKKSYRLNTFINYVYFDKSMLVFSVYNKCAHFLVNIKNIQNLVENLNYYNFEYKIIGSTNYNNPKDLDYSAFCIKNKLPIDVANGITERYYQIIVVDGISISVETAFNLLSALDDIYEIIIVKTDETIYDKNCLNFLQHLEF